MNVGMMLQLLVPGVEDAEESDFSAETVWVAGDLEQGLGAGAHQQIVDEPLVLQSQGRQEVRKGEDHVDIMGRQEFLPPRLQPAVAGPGLTLGTVPISAGNGVLSITCIMGSSS